MTKCGIGAEDDNDMEGYKRMWEIRGTTYLLLFTIPNTGILTCQIRYGKMIHRHNSLKSQHLMIISPNTSHPYFPYFPVLSTTLPSPEGTKLSQPFQLPLPWAYVYMEFNIDPWLCLSCYQPDTNLSASGTPCYTRYSAVPKLWVNQ